MADEKKRGGAMASALFGSGEAGPEGGEEAEPDTEGAYSESVQAFMDAVSSQDLEAAKGSLREAVHFAGLLGPPGMAEGPAESEE